MLKAKMQDGNVLVIANFEKRMASLAMIDHENIPRNIKRGQLKKMEKQAE